MLVSLFSVVEDLLGRKHVLSEQTLCVRKFAYSKTDLLLKGLTDDISYETLKLFIEAKLIKSEFKLVLNEDRTRALIQAEEPIGILADIRKTCPCNVYPLEPHFYIAKLGYAGVYLFFLFLL